MLGKKMVSLRKITKRIKVSEGGGRNPAQKECLLREFVEDQESSSRTPTGFLALYVGDDRQRFVVPTGFLSHPLFKMLLEKSRDEFGFDQRSGLVVPCSVSTFQEVVNAVECSNAKFHFGELVDEFL